MLFSHDLWSHGVRCAKSSVFSYGIVDKLFWESKVSNFELWVVDENILSFDVSVNDVMGMKLGYSMKNLFDDHDSFVLWYFIALFDVFVKSVSVAVLHDYYLEIHIFVNVIAFDYMWTWTFHHD